MSVQVPPGPERGSGGGEVLVLASSSPRRRALLEQLGVAFQVVPPRVVEGRFPPGRPAACVERLAVAKASEVAARVGRGLVVGADTVVVHRRTVLGKPQGPADAVRMLQRLSGDLHRVYTGLAVVRAGTGECQSGYEVTRVRFRELTPSEIEAYVATGEPLDKAGAYGIQGRGALLVREVRGCFYNVVGLPLARLAELLAPFGVRLL